MVVEPEMITDKLIILQLGLGTSGFDLRLAIIDS
jgi:hypothetical protein